MVLVEVRALGMRRALEPEWSVPVPSAAGRGDEDLTLRLLIERIVRAEVQQFRERANARRFLRVLSQREINEGAAAGKVDAGGRETPCEVDSDEAVATALAGFEDGLYKVLLDGVEQTELDRQVYLTDASRLVFLRLTFLAGG